MDHTVPHFLVPTCMAAICIGLPIGLYFLFTVDERKTSSEMRREAVSRGWRYRNKAGGFRIEGSTSGLGWVMTSGNSREGEMRWSSDLDLRFPEHGGETDVAILPRDRNPLPIVALSPTVEARIARFSGTLAGAARFLRDAHELRTGVAEFDAAYEVRVRQTGSPPVDAPLAGRILHWPADAVTPHSIVAWRDPFGFHFNARLPEPPNRATAVWLTSLGADCAARLPAAVIHARQVI